jgi:hypothetical protein
MSSVDQCMRITISMKRNGTNPIITRISSEELTVTKTAFLEVGMEVTSLSYDGQSAYLARDNLKQENGGRPPFFAKQSVCVPGAGAGVIAVAMKKVLENNTDSFLIRGVMVGSQSSWRGSQLVEVLVYSVTGTLDDTCGTDESERVDASPNESSASEHHDEYSVSSSEETEDALRPEPNKSSRRPPPPGVPCGGCWSTQTFIGRRTMVISLVGCCFLGFVGPMVLCCPLDERNVYIVDGKVYAECGKYVRLEG